MYFIFFCCQYQCSQLSGKTRLRNDLLCVIVKWDVKSYTLRTSAAPANQISSAIGIFQDLGHWGCEPTFGVLSYTLLSYSLPFPLLSSPSTLPLSPRRVWGGAPSEIEVGAFSLKIWHPVATNLKIFLRIKWPNFTQNFPILCRILKHLNSAKH